MSKTNETMQPEAVETGTLKLMLPCALLRRKRI